MQTHTRRTKKVIPALMPVKKALSLPEACAYMDMSINVFMALGLPMSVVGAKKYFRVADMDALINDNFL
jgi:hypothetical protein